MSNPPGPGVYEDVPFEDYLTWPYISNSRLAPAARSLLHYKTQRPIEETPQMRFGTLCHAGKLDPLSIPMKYAVMPAFEQQVRKPDGTEYDKPKMSGAYRKLAGEFMANNLGKITVTQFEFDNMAAVVRALISHDRARLYLDAPGPIELSLVWDDPETGLRLKGRIDKWCPAEKRITDLKTCRDPMDFERQMYLRGYHRQAAMYRDGVRILLGVEASVAMVAVENVHPFGVRAAPLSLAAIDRGGEDYHELLRGVAESQASGKWPGFSDPDEWELPGWTDAADDVSLTFGGEGIVV